jgi:nitrogen fixation NifU-like protein
MPEDFNKFTKKLQEQIIKKEIEEHNEKIVNLYHNPQNWGKPQPERITVYEERRGGPKQDFLGLYLKIENDFIIEAKFVTDGCGVMVATGSQMTLLIEGKPIEYAESLKSEDINDALMGIPYDEKYCIDLAIDTLKNAIQKYQLEK